MTNHKIEKYISDYICLVRDPKFLFYFKLYLLLFVTGLSIAIIIGMTDVDISKKVIFVIKNYTSLKFSNFDMVSILENNFFISILVLFYFNLKGGLFKKYFGVFYFLYLGVIGGFAISIIALKYNIIIALAGILPHGIIEIPTVIYAASSGWILSNQNKNQDKNIKAVFIFDIIVIFILLTISSYAEVHITPYIYDRLLNYYY